jgi:hypothetical protein
MLLVRRPTRSSSDLRATNEAPQPSICVGPNRKAVPFRSSMSPDGEPLSADMRTSPVADKFFPADGHEISPATATSSPQN